MGSVFWDAKAVLLVDLLEKVHTITGAYYAELFRATEENQDLVWEAEKRRALQPG